MKNIVLAIIHSQSRFKISTIDRRDNENVNNFIQ